MTIALGSVLFWLLNLAGAALIAGRRRAGWLVALAAQIPWTWHDLRARQPGFLLLTLTCVPVQVRGWRTARNLARLPSGAAGGWPAAETAGTPGGEAMLTLAEPIGTGLLPGGCPAPPRHSLRRPRGGSISYWA